MPKPSPNLTDVDFFNPTLCTLKTRDLEFEKNLIPIHFAFFSRFIYKFLSFHTKKRCKTFSPPNSSSWRRRKNFFISLHSDNLFRPEQGFAKEKYFFFPAQNLIFFLLFLSLYLEETKLKVFKTEASFFLPSCPHKLPTMCVCIFLSCLWNMRFQNSENKKLFSSFLRKWKEFVEKSEGKIFSSFFSLRRKQKEPRKEIEAKVGRYLFCSR